jgi:hypothetical protein
MSKNLLPAETEYLCPNAKPKLRSSLNWLAILELFPNLDSFVEWLSGFYVSPNLHSSLSLSLETRRENVLDSLAEWLAEGGANYDVYAYLDSKLSLDMGIGCQDVLASAIGLALETKRNNVLNRSIGLSLETKRNNVLDSSLSAKYTLTEELYTDAFNARLMAWSEIGASPYLNDSDANFITTNIDGEEEGDWTFPVSLGSGEIDSVKLRLENRLTVIECGDIEVYVSPDDGASWVYAGTVGMYGLIYSWQELEVKTILDTWSKIALAKVYVHYTKNTTGIGYIRRLTRKIVYTVTVP